MESKKRFEGHVSAEFDFNIIDLLKCHFRIHGFGIISFRADIVIVQTISLYPIQKADINGIYATIISLSSLREYDYDCNLDKVNIVISRMLITDLPSATKIGCINVVNDKPFRFCDDGYGGQFLADSDDDDDGECDEHYKELNRKFRETYPIVREEEAVEVSFDLIHSNRKTKLKTTVCEDLGVHNNEPYPHFLVKSRLGYSIQEDCIDKYVVNSSEFESILINDVKAFKSLWRDSKWICVKKNGCILFHFNVVGKAIIGEKCKEKWLGIPKSAFKPLFNFIGCSKVRIGMIRASGFKSGLEDCHESSDFKIINEYFTTYAEFGKVI